MHPCVKLDTICGLLILLFLYTAFSKWMDFPHFHTVLHQSPLIRHFAGSLSWIIPVTEVIIAVCLWIPPFRKIGLIASLLLLILFSLYISYMLLYVPHLPCSCGGVIQLLSWRQHLLFNLFFIGVSCAGIYLTRKPRNWSSNLPFPSREDIL